MSKIVFICFRDSKHKIYSDNNINILSTRIIPDNISPPAPLIINGKGIHVGIFNPSEALLIKNTSACMGNLIDPEDNWWEPMAKVPDGSYALFRSDEKVVELLSDIVASRTIWYVQTEEMFIASTSQRAIVFFLRDYKPNKAAFSWILSSGTLGPDLSWDSRIRCLSANSRLFLDRLSWKLTIKKEKATFDPLDISDEEHEMQLKDALKYTFEHLQLDYSKWFLPLSGGFDSRAILLMLNNRQKLKCITWGLKSSLVDKNNDAYIAKSLSKYFSLEHEFFETNISSEPIEMIFNRFLVAGEGRIDHISGYMDGFKIWKHLFEVKASGIIRGDEGFGWLPVNMPYDVRRHIEAHLLSDFNFNCIDKFNLEKQTWPKNLQRREKESLAAWRDRLYHEFRIPIILAALNDLKCCYVEVINPLLSRRIIEQARKIPDHLRTDKKLFKKIVYSMSPKLGFAKHSAIADAQDILRRKEVVNLISSELNTAYAKTLLSDAFINHILKNLENSETLNKATSKNKDCIAKRQIDYSVLAFRAYIICKMNQIFSADANACNRESA